MFSIFKMKQPFFSRRELLKFGTQASLLTASFSVLSSPAASGLRAREELSREADVVVVGAGGAGLCAAIEAKQAGADVVIVEKNDAVGGNTAISTGFFNAAAPDSQGDSVEIHIDETLAVGSLASREDDRRFARLPAPEGAVYWEGFKVRETQAFLSADKLTETLLFTRVSAKAGVPDAARLARVIGGVLAVAQEVQGSGDRLQTEITVIRSREAATRGGDVFESALVALSGAGYTSKRESKHP